ncbi:spore coat protein CotJB [Cohnella faecalis]|uniref:Spore coat protein CotJB n=1 Tax=Cohnella faecalis TaxID=2315694 RepID=A0A398CNN7_9BACL|nr:spore coat protein CotJB [Cohnella faecalis]RIE03942.1 spore coat protein CotJB [Cohnella faecalis]
MVERRFRELRDQREEKTEEKQPERGNEAYRKELEELQKVDFALVELTLYLDNHPTDMQSIQQFNQLAQLRGQLAYAFEMKYGPLMQYGHSFSRYPWQWIESPWPWQV